MEFTMPLNTRRNFLGICVAVPFIGLAGLKMNEVQISHTRPMQSGILGSTYFEAGLRPEFQGKSIIIKGFEGARNLYWECFELDSVSGFVGLYATHIQSGKRRILVPDSGSVIRFWVKGEVVTT